VIPVSSAVRTAIVVWVVMMVSTAASTWWFSRDAIAPVVSTVAVMVIAAVKVALVMAYFMELRIAPIAWRLAGTVWVVGAAGTVIGVYLA
jgi:heme/copper-type cytochrome/quinol oxidase subunit 4